MLEKNTPGTINGLDGIRRGKEEKKTEPRNFESEDKNEGKFEEKPELKPGILTRIKNAIFG